MNWAAEKVKNSLKPYKHYKLYCKEFYGHDSADLSLNLKGIIISQHYFNSNLITKRCSCKKILINNNKQQRKKKYMNANYARRFEEIYLKCTSYA